MALQIQDTLKDTIEDTIQDAIIGHTGLVGSYIKRMMPNAVCFNSKNSSEMRGQTFGTVFFAGISATKWYANKNPEEDKERVLEVLDNLFAVKANRVVFISTIDVYNDDIDQELSEKDRPKPGTEAYGNNRRMAEDMVVENFGPEHVSIVRLCGLFGFGLKKNIVYDFIQEKLQYLWIRSKYQWYSLEWLEEDLQYILKNRIPLINLFTEPLPNDLLADLFKTVCPDQRFEQRLEEMDERKIYDLQTDYGNSFGDGIYWRSMNAVLYSLERYLQHMCHGRLVVSNLCTQGALSDAACLEDFGIREMEVAPHKHFGAGYTERPLSYFRSKDFGSIYSFQSLHYPERFESLDAALDYTCRVVDIAHVVGAKILVFGSPKMRSKLGSRLEMIEFFRSISDHIGRRAIILCIEPNAKQYGCSFLTTGREARQFLKEVNRPKNIRLILDVGCMTMEGENVQKELQDSLEWLSHVHFSAPFLKPLTASGNYSWLRHKLSLLGYRGKITLEMLNVTQEQLRSSIDRVLKDPSFSIIGAGWYGCHLALTLLNTGFNPVVYEKTGVFTGTSVRNQNRLHLGFHYPRSSKTRLLCKENFNQFRLQYGELVDHFDNNIYAVANESILDAGTYKQVMEAEGLALESVDLDEMGIVGCEEGFSVFEGVIDHEAARNYFTKRLHRQVRIETIDTLEGFEGLDVKVLDCSYNSFKTIKDVNMCITLSLVYEKKTKGTMGLTIMDGDFCSLYPVDTYSGMYTLTHVKHGVIQEDSLEEVLKAKVQMEEEITKFLPSFKTNFIYKNYFIAYKCKIRSGCDSRHLVTKRNKNVTSFMCGKITGIYDAERFVI